MKKQYAELKNRIFETRELYKELEDIIERIERESLDPDNNSYYQVYYDIEDKSFYTPEFSSYTDSTMPLDKFLYLIGINNSYNYEFFVAQRAYLEDENLTDKQVIDLIIDDIVADDMRMIENNLHAEAQKSR